MIPKVLPPLHLKCKLRLKIENYLLNAMSKHAAEVSFSAHIWQQTERVFAPVMGISPETSKPETYIQAMAHDQQA